MMRRRSKKGSSIAEFAAVLMLGVPILIGLLYAGVETCHYFAIKSALDTAARSAARALAINFGNTGSKSDPYTGTVKIPHYIDPAANQFTIVWDGATPPKFVTVTCKYPAGGNSGAGLPPFPNPDIFNLGPSFTMMSTFTASIE